MSNLKELIAEFCLDGVEYRKLGEVCAFQRGATITKKNIVDGQIPVIAGGQKPAYYHNVSNRSGESIVVSSSGAYSGFISFWNIPIFLSDSFSVEPDFKILEPKYVFYFLKNIQEMIYTLQKGGGVPHVYSSDLARIVFPLPPLPVQREIVRILDNFTELTAELTAELAARKKQYEYYRDSLLTFGDEVERKALGEVVLKTLNIRWNLEEDAAEYEYIDLTSVDRETNEILDTKTITKDNAPSRAQQIVNVGDIIFGTTRPLLKRHAVINDKYDKQICSTGFCVLRADTNQVLAKWIYYNVASKSYYNHIERFEQGASYPAISDTNVKKYSIPVPSLPEQERIVSILDKFDSLVNDLTSGLPAEIEARRKQYEYYRDKLLTFKEKIK